MDAIASGNLEVIVSLSEASIAVDAGRSAHESKTWLIARSALGVQGPARLLYRYYQDIPAYIAGFGLMIMEA
jgi:2,3-dihydroxyphenylpropionate 1,2-dioxygenase